MKVFDGPSEYSDTATVTSLFPIPVDARYIRILPIHWNGKPCLRFELLGCNGGMYSKENEMKIRNTTLFAIQVALDTPHKCV